MLEEVVPAALAGERADRAVSFVTGCGRSAAAALVRAGGVRLNGRTVRKGSTRLAEGDILRIDDAELNTETTLEPDADIPVDIVYEDDQVLVVDKQAGLVVHPGAGSPTGTLVNALVARYPDLVGVGEPTRPGIVHRLDKGTTGLLMVARTDQALEHLSRQLIERSVERTYLTVVWDHLESDRGLIDAAIGRDRRNPMKMAVLADGREARTGYEVVRRAEEPAPVTVLHCRLETGRTHQIRVHCRAIGHPVVGDTTYGGWRESVPFSRPALHAAVLGFEHPTTGEQLRFTSEPPEDMAELLATLVP